MTSRVEPKRMRRFFTDTGIEVPAMTAEQMRALDRIAMEDTGPNLFQMMENAGRNLALLAVTVLGEAWTSARIKGGWLSHSRREPSGIFKGDEPGSRRAYRSGISSEHDSGSLLAWAVPRAEEKPAGGRAVMATTESRGAVEAEILPPCQRDTGQ